MGKRAWEIVYQEGAKITQRTSQKCKVQARQPNRVLLRKEWRKIRLKKTLTLGPAQGQKKNQTEKRGYMSVEKRARARKPEWDQKQQRKKRG